MTKKFFIPFKKLSSLFSDKIRVDGEDLMFELSQKSLKFIKNEPYRNFSSNFPKNYQEAVEYSKILIANLAQQNDIYLYFKFGIPVLNNYLSLSNLIAVYILKPENIYLIINGSIPENGYDFIKVCDKSDIRSIKSISWELPKKDIPYKWNDPIYVLNELRTAPICDIVSIFKKMDDSLNMDSTFVEEVLVMKNLRDLVPKSIKQSEVYFDICLKNPKAFLYQYHSNFKDILNEANELIYNLLYPNSYHQDKNFENHLYNIKNIDLLKEGFSKETFERLSIAKKIIEKVYSNNSFCLQILDLLLNDKDVKTSYNSLMSLIYLFDDKVKVDKRFQDKVYELIEKSPPNYGNIKFSKILPKELFCDKKAVKDILFKEVNANYPSSCDLFPQFSQEIIMDDLEFLEKILKIAKEKHGATYLNNLISNIKRDFPIEFINGIDFFKLLLKFNQIHMDGYFINQSTKSQYFKYLKDEKVIDYIFNNIEAESISHLPEFVVHKIKDKDLLLSVLKFEPSFFMEKNPPKEWREDIDIVCVLGGNVEFLNFKSAELKNLIKSENDAIKIVNAYPFIIKKLEKKWSKNYNVVVAAIKRNPQSIVNIDKHILLNRDFCIELLKISSTLFENIPKVFFYEKDFMLSLFDGLDKGLIKETIVGKLPKEINLCLDSFNVKKGNYLSFANSFFTNQELHTDLKINYGAKKPHLLKI